MGFFPALVICVLNEAAGHFEGETHVVKFEDPTYISWESEALPEPEWQSGGPRSIHFRGDGVVAKEFSYPQGSLVSPIEVRFLKKKREFRFRGTFRGEGDLEGVYHLVLPEGYVPDTRTFQDLLRPHIKKVANRIALTWPFREAIALDFIFKEASKEEFGQFAAAGTPTRIVMDSGFKALMGRVGERLVEEGKDVLAGSITSLIRP